MSTGAACLPVHKLSRPQRIGVGETIIDPVLFAEKYLEEDLWSKQVEIMRAVEENERTAVRDIRVRGCGPGRQRRRQIWLPGAARPAGLP